MALIKSHKQYWGLNQIYNTKTHTLTFTSGKLTWNHTKKHPIFVGTYIELGDDGTWPDDPTACTVSVAPDVVYHAPQNAYYKVLIVKHIVFSSKVDTSQLTDAQDMFKGSAITSLSTDHRFADHITNMHKMFAGTCLDNTKSFKNWDVSHVTDFGGMFEQIDIGDNPDNKRLDITDLNYWTFSDPNSVKNMFGVGDSQTPITENKSMLKRHLPIQYYLKMFQNKNK